MCPSSAKRSASQASWEWISPLQWAPSGSSATFSLDPTTQSSTLGTTEWASPRQPSRADQKTEPGIEERNEQQQQKHHFYKSKHLKGRLGPVLVTVTFLDQ